MRTTSLKSPGLVLIILLLLVAVTSTTGRAASVDASGYTNSFGAQPPASDWSTFSIGTGSGDYGTAATLDAAATSVNAGSIISLAGSDPGDPPAFNGLATWSSTGLYLQTRPTGNGATLLMCTLLNNLGGDAIAANISYDLARSAPVVEEVDGHRAYYSLSGAPGSWTVIPEFSTNVAGRLTANLNLTWPNGASLYLLWADDNGSGTPDTVYQIDNFSVALTPGAHKPVTITNQPQSQMVGELQPVTFTIGLSGYPPPTVQWYTNDVPIAGATSTSYTIPSTPLGYNGLGFKAIAQNVASNVSYSVTSSVATLTVNADTVAPVLLSAFAASLNQVLLSFSERLALSSVTSLANYSVTGATGNLVISNAVLDASQTNIILTVSTMTAGSTYTATVHGVTDQSAAANMVAANSQAQFTVSTYNGANIGNPAVAGSATPAGNGYAVTGDGTNIFGAADQFFFNSRQISGDFDVKVRIDALTAGDSWAKAGLMARETLDATSRHASAFATPGAGGTFFSYRFAAGGTTTNTGSFPIAYPNTWLRLRRSGTNFTGYAGVDGQNWVQLGTIGFIAPANIFYVGMAVTGASTNNQTATAQFRDLGDATGGSVGTVDVPFEPLGPSSRNTGLVISEIMYHPKPSNDLEFIEVFNAGLISENIGGYRISGNVDYVFPANTILPVGGFIVVARNPARLQTVYGISGVLGPWNDAANVALPDDQGTVRLRNRASAILLEVSYEGRKPWPVAADGSGHSLVLARPSYGEADPRAWSASDRIGGSPGRLDSYSLEPLRAVVINEFLAHTDPPLEDFIELYNHSNQPVDVSGAYLSDDRDTNKFRIPNGTTIPARGFVSFTVNTNTTGFALSSAGERIYFVNSNQTKVLDVVVFEAQANGVSSGRYPDGAPGFQELTSRTPGANNSAPLIREIVINELMFHPISGDEDGEYVELYNRSGNAVNVGNWRFTDGINFTFAPDAIVPANGYLVVAKNQTNLLARYPQLNSGNTVGNYGGNLSHGGERIALARPDYFLVTNNSVVSTQANYIVVDEVTYVDSGRWAHWADGGGSSLELIDPNSDNNLPANWADSDETGKSQWTTLSVTGLMDHVYPVDPANGALLNEIQVMILGAGEALMDDVDVHLPGGPNLVVNPGFNGGLNDWLIQGNHVRSSLEPVGPNNPSPSMRIRATAGGDNGANRVECNLAFNGTQTNLPPNTIGSLQAKFRWLRGFPIVLMRLHGGALEAVGSLPIPPNLGTPGQPNSRRLANAGPAIYDVTHNPPLPGSGQPVVVTARVNDPDGIASVQLRYRIDPSSTTNTLTMRDDGTGGDAVAGDGVYSATIPGQTIATNAFRILATDSQGASTLFPDAATGECIVRFGDPPIFGSLGVYRFWTTTANYNFWRDRERLSNEPVDGTMVYGNFRVIYNAGARYRGSPFTRNPSSPNGVGVAANYVWSLPDDDLFCGTDELNLDCLEPGGSSNVRDVTALREVTSFTMVDQMNLPFSFQRYVHIVINGVTSASRNIPVYTDSQQPNGEYVTMWFPDDDEGDLFKIDDWFEFDDTPARQSNKSASLENFTTTGGVKKQARYRWSWEKKFNRGLDDDYSTIFTAVDALAAPEADYVTQLESTFELREWLTMLAFRHVVGDWDGYGYQRGKNQFCYRPNGGKLWMLMWDLDFSIGCNGGHGPTQDLLTLSVGGLTASDSMPEVQRMYNTVHTRRIYLQALQQIADGPLQDANFMPTLDARYRALLANGVNAITSPYANSGAQSISLPAWIQQRRDFIYTGTGNSIRLSLFNTAFAVTTSTNFTTNADLVTVSGNAPLTVKDVVINGVPWPVTWLSVTSWTARVVLEAGGNSFRISATDLHGNPITSTQIVTAVYTGPAVSAAGNIVINEIMYNPTAAGSSFVELLNNSSNAFDLSNWRLNGLGYSFRPGTILTNRQVILLAKNKTSFGAAFGTAVNVFDEFDGDLDNDGETLTLIKPGATPALDQVIDQVHYEAVEPWPTNANGIGSSLQLIDPGQDNARVSNWSDGSGWRFYSTNANSGSLAAPRLFMFLDKASDVYIDNISLVAGAVPEVGPNLLSNGDFEGPLSGPWGVGGSHSNTLISTDIKFAGNGSLHIVATAAGTPATNNSIWQDVVVAPNTVYTLSYWFLTNAITTNKLTTRLNSTFRPENTIRPVFSTPGVANSTAALVPPYPPLWLNEVQPQNLNSILDNAGDRDPWLELYNAGTNTLSLEGYYLANNYSNLTQWAFPAGASIGPRQFKIIWLDGEPGETAGSSLHTSFVIPHNNGSVALSRNIGQRAQLVDYLNYKGVGPSLSYGDYPDGQPFHRRVLYTPSPGATNAARDITIFINEWLADNTIFDDPDEAGANFEDWFELYNPGDTPVDLSGYYLTDTNANKTQFTIPNGFVIPAGGFRLVWADGEPSQNTSNSIDLHVNFNLRAAGEYIGLYAPDGTTLIDEVTFGAQSANVSEGRWPDGAATRYFMATPTPKAANVISGGNTSPTIGSISDKNVSLGQSLSFTISATDTDVPPQTLSFSLVNPPAGASIGAGNGLFSWTPTPAQAPSTNTITVRVDDNGAPPLHSTRDFTVYVLLGPRATVQLNGNILSIRFGTQAGRHYRVEYKNDLNLTNWTILQDNLLGTGAELSINDNITASSQRFYRIVQLD